MQQQLEAAAAVLRACKLEELVAPLAAWQQQEQERQFATREQYDAAAAAGTEELLAFVLPFLEMPGQIAGISRLQLLHILNHGEGWGYFAILVGALCAACQCWVRYRGGV